MDLERAVHMIDWHAFRWMLRVHGVGGKLLKIVQTFIVDNKGVTQWFPVSV